MALAGVGVVLGIVAGNADLEVGINVPFGRQAGRCDVLVVVVLAGDDVLAVAVAIERCDRAADAERVRQGRAGRDDDFFLAVGADSGAHVERRLIGQRTGDVFDSATDGVATVERALRAAQDFDALDVEHVKDGALRTVEIDVVNIDADTGFETGNRVLLADTADEGGERGVGATRDFERNVRGNFRDFGDVCDAEFGEQVAIKGGDRQWHVDEVLFAALGGDDDRAEAALGLCTGVIVGLGESRRERCQRAGCQSDQRDAGCELVH